MKNNIAEIKDRKFSEKDGRYLIKGVQINFGQRGYRQIIELDKRISLPENYG